ncbi:MAG: distantly related to DP-Man: Dol-P b-mannosyltransferase [Verrucomicrobiales bacterium]|nr:distantly related to DP-Man: Dol-P b-mannosyltransferase [Verrucomicrobiales bacterium]
MSVLPLPNPEDEPFVTSLPTNWRVAVVIPCYKVVPYVCGVIARIGPEVHSIICVDDACPDGSGDHIRAHCNDPRVEVLVHPRNLGVGGATLTGCRHALEGAADIIVKVDGDGQMAPEMIGRFLRPILLGRADYTKGNRFFMLRSLSSMPKIRLVGNAVLSFFTKLSTGYWHVMDPTNGYVAIHHRVLAELLEDKVSQRYFFESDLLFRLNTLAAVVEDVPMDASYEHLHSSLRIREVFLTFLWNNLVNTAKRIFYTHFLRNFSVASLELLLGLAAFLFGTAFGLERWAHSLATGHPVTCGTVMLAALPVLLGTQLILSFVAHDVRSTPQIPLHKRL